MTSGSLAGLSMLPAARLARPPCLSPRPAKEDDFIARNPHLHWHRQPYTERVTFHPLWWGLRGPCIPIPASSDRSQGQLSQPTAGPGRAITWHLGARGQEQTSEFLPKLGNVWQGEATEGVGPGWGQDTCRSAARAAIPHPPPSWHREEPCQGASHGEMEPPIVGHKLRPWRAVATSWAPFMGLG